MEVSLAYRQEAQLNTVALKTGRGTDELVQEAVTRLLVHTEWIQQQVQVGIARSRAVSSLKKKWMQESHGYFRFEAYSLGARRCR